MIQIKLSIWILDSRRVPLHTMCSDLLSRHIRVPHCSTSRIAPSQKGNCDKVSRVKGMAMRLKYYKLLKRFDKYWCKINMSKYAGAAMWWFPWSTSLHSTKSVIPQHGDSMQTYKHCASVSHATRCFTAAHLWMRHSYLWPSWWIKSVRLVLASAGGAKCSPCWHHRAPIKSRCAQQTTVGQ